MSDFYTEQLVKRKTPTTSRMLQILLILITIGSAGAFFIMPFLILIPVVLVIVDIIIFRSMNVEYEYLYVNGTLQIDKIMAKSRRKTILEMNVNDLEVLAPQATAELRPYQGIKAKNYGSRCAESGIYEMIYVQSGVKKRIIFEPNSVIINGMKMLAPRKVFQQN